ncbi:MAG TPA: CocE/NonD family hydrolase [Ktedonobacterales bacterium]
MVPQSSRPVRASFDVAATMRDGTVLRANVFQPDDGGAGRYPVLLTRLPYGKDLPLGSAALIPEQAARLGYVVVVQDVRGTFASDGEFFPMLAEQRDGYDTVEWAARLPGANGEVGMYGVSYFGHTQWAAASQHPPSLRALLPMHTWNDTGAPNAGVVWRNGVLQFGGEVAWQLEMALPQLPRRIRNDPQALARAIYALTREIDRLPTQGFSELPLDAFGPFTRAGTGEAWRYSIEARENPALAVQSAVAAAYELPLPVFHIGGWYDLFLGGTIANFQAMRAAGNRRQWLLIGPWTHGNVNHVQGDVDFGFVSGGALLDYQIDLMSLSLQFFDHALKGAANLFNAMPPVKYFLMGANVWKSAGTWPPAEAATQAWYLASSGHANSLRGDGTLSSGVSGGRPTGAEAVDSFAYNPAAPVPTVGGAHQLPAIFRRGPVDQRPVEERDDVLVYSSAPLEAPVVVAGPVAATLYVATDAPDTDFVARLVDVYPDGRAIALTDGVVRLSLREGLQTRAEVRSGEVYRVEIDLWSTANAFLPGHRIRLDVTSSSFPRWERNLNTGADCARSTQMCVARQRVLHDADHPSHLTLYVLPAEDAPA